MRAFPVLASLERGKQDACAPVQINYKESLSQKKLYKYFRILKPDFGILRKYFVKRQPKM
jgi:hypothetical protein